MAGCTHLFVYGSFCKGMVHAEMLTNFIQHSQLAWIRGTVYRLPVGYPVFVAEGNDLVEGQLLKLGGAAVLGPILDEFHGFSELNRDKSLFLKTRIEARLNDGTSMTASTYAYNPLKLSSLAQPIPDGKWRQDLQQAPCLPERLTERQQNYIRRLGASSGRDILPIELDLYGELMKLDLIVDKGRRLALSRLGKEVCRYLRKA